jgi:Large extracellular alpha-helical protein
MFRYVRAALAAAAFLLIAPVMNAQSTPDKDGHVLTALWKQFDEASKADRPQKEAEILSKIKAEAQKQRLAADFYDAAVKYMESVQRRDWKKREELRTNLKKEVETFADPMVTYQWMGDYGNASSDERWAFVRDRADAFRAGHNPALYRGIGGLMGGAMKDFVASDYEYVLWNLLGARRYDDPEKDEIYRTLKAEVAGKYPGEGYLAFYIANRAGEKDARRKALEGVAEKYAGKAVAFWPRQELLRMDFTDLNEKNAGQAAYQALYHECLGYEKQRGALKGDEAKIAKGCEGVKGLVNTLTSKGVQVRLIDNKACVTFRNLDKATLTLREDKKTVKTWNLTNPDRSFYVYDTVKVDLPTLGDGAYTLEVVNGKMNDLAYYNQHTLSLAVRRESSGYAAYVTDYLTGKPLDKVKLTLWKSDKEVLSETVRLDGFTQLPKKFQETVRNNKNVYYALTAETGSGTDLRASRRVSVRSYYDDGDNEDRSDGVYCNLYKDRGAYNPGDVLQFKAVVYEGNLVDRVSVVPDKTLEVVLYNEEDKEIDRLKLKTNAFGSASGSFTLPKGERNGYFHIVVKSGRKDLAYDSFRVDEFVLPTFTLTFDPNDKLYLVGDEVVVKGKVRSYSGHSLTGANLAVKVDHWGSVVLEKDITPEADGTFSFVFPAAETGWFNAEVTVTDATGEMQEFSAGVYVSDHITVSLSMENGAEGEFVPMEEKNAYMPGRYVGRWRPSPSKYIATGETARVKMQVNNSDGNQIDVPVQYELMAEDSTVVRSGKAASGEVVDIDLKGLPDGLYSLVGKASERDAKDEAKCWILKIDPKGKVLDAPVRRVFLTGPADVPVGEKIRLTMGTADGAEYAIVTLFGKGRKVLETRKVVLKGVRAKEGSLTTVEFDYKPEYPDAVRLQVFYFKRGEAITFDKEYSRTRTRLALPLKFESFTDKAFPGTTYTFTLKTDPGVEALAAVYDQSIDAIAGNYWPVVTLREFSVPYVNVESACGRVSGDDPYGDDLVLDEVAVVGYGARSRMSMRSMNAMVAEEAAMDAEAPMMMQKSAGALADLEYGFAPAPGSDAGADVQVRSKFENALSFQPHLLSDASGNLSFTFNTSDKLSTYYVALYAHDKGMRNAYLREEMVVSVPVKVAVVEPQFLYMGDTYEVAASVSSNSDKPVSGWLYLYTYPSAEYEGVEPMGVQRVAVTVPAGGTETHRFPIRVPAVETIGFKVVFAADEFSDAVFLPVPVKKPVQTLTEAHSAVLRAGMSRETLLAELRSRFVNVPASEAALTETTLLDLVRAAIPAKADPDGNDVLSISEAYYVRLLAEKISPLASLGRNDGEPAITSAGSSVIPSEAKESLLPKVLACRNADGGFGWFEGMDSSPVITAVLLSRFAKLRDHGFEVPDLTSSVKFLDNNHFATELPYWRGYLSDAQYLFVRSLYPTVPFEVKPVTKEGKKRFSDFQKYAKEYLVPSAKDGRGLQGQIMAKARRVQTLLNLSATSEGVVLAKAWGVKVAAKSRMEASLKADITSLKEYAVEHRDGGWYYPNAVMPWRGLLETEADAHALLCNLMQPYAPQISDGIRLWLMLQKETQKWDESPAFVDAITAILDGSDEVLSTSILSYSATYDKPFADIKAAGNGFTIARKFFREKTVEKQFDDRTTDKNDQVTVREEITPGTPVAVGDKIIAEYQIWNQENRSFVKVDAFREAALRPVQQLSGPSRWGWFNLRRLTFTPQGYRNVKADRTEYYFDSFPEENTTLTEEFFVTQAGTFTAPVITVESLYAPHYRANDAFHGVLSVE